ncbi:MAG TPA: DUF5946 family protein [Vicinamibacteria bacterium]
MAGGKDRVRWIAAPGRRGSRRRPGPVHRVRGARAADGGPHPPVPGVLARLLARLRPGPGPRVRRPRLRGAAPPHRGHLRRPAPGRPSPQAIQSVCLHLVSLCLVLERGADPAYATRVLSAAARRKEPYSWLPPPPSRGAVTVADVVPATSPAAHAERVRAWADSAWSAWSAHHATVREWLPGALRP